MCVLYFTSILHGRGRLYFDSDQEFSARVIQQLGAQKLSRLCTESKILCNNLFYFMLHVVWKRNNFQSHCPIVE